MAIDQGTEVIPATTVHKSRRSWRTNVESKYGSDYVVTSFRQPCKRDAAGNLVDPLVDDTSNPTVFSFQSVASRVFTRADGSTLTGAQLASDISLVIDAIDIEQLAASPEEAPASK